MPRSYLNSVVPARGEQDTAIVVRLELENEDAVGMARRRITTQTATITTTATRLSA